MVNAALPIQLCVQDLPGWLHTRLQPSQTYRCIQCSPCQNLALTTPTRFCFGSLGDKAGLQATDFHLYNAEKPKVGSAGASTPSLRLLLSISQSLEKEESSLQRAVLLSSPA